MTFREVAVGAADVTTLMAEGLDALTAFVNAPVLHTIDEFVHGANAILGAIAKAQSGMLTSADVRAELAKLKPALAAGDAVADATLPSAR